MANRIKKLLVNKYEEETFKKIEDTTKRYNSKVYAKVRLADVFTIENSGISNKEYEYALKSHFDFVIVDQDYNCLFAVEFDGYLHNKDTGTMYRDKLKNHLCQKLNFPLIRINASYLNKIGKFPSLIRWLIEMFFIYNSFNEAQEKGDIPFDEPWMWFSVVNYDPFISSKFYMEKSYLSGICVDPRPQIFDGYTDSFNTSASLAILKVDDDKYLTAGNECKLIDFYAICSGELSREIAQYDIANKLKKYNAGKLKSKTRSEVKKDYENFFQYYTPSKYINCFG